MADDNSVFDALDDQTEPAGGDDFADWWEPENAGDELVGVLMEMHSEPQEWTDAGEVPDTIRTVVSVGRGDVDAGKAVTPKQHKQLQQAFASRDVGLGDLLKIEFTGYQKVESRNQPMNTYEVGVLEEETWRELDDAEAIDAVLEEYTGTRGDNRRTEPYESAGADNAGGTDPVADDDSELGQAASALKKLVSVQGGEVDVETADNIITDIRGFDVELENAAAFAGLTIEGGSVSR